MQGPRTFDAEFRYRHASYGESSARLRQLQEIREMLRYADDVPSNWPPEMARITLDHATNATIRCIEIRVSHVAELIESEIAATRSDVDIRRQHLLDLAAQQS